MKYNFYFVFNETVRMTPLYIVLLLLLYAMMTPQPHKWNVLDAKVLVYSSPFCMPTYTPSAYLDSQTTNCRVRGCIRFHISTLSSFDVFPPVSPLVMEFATSKKWVPLFFRKGTTQVHFEWPSQKGGIDQGVNLIKIIKKKCIKGLSVLDCNLFTLHCKRIDNESRRYTAYNFNF